MDGRFAWSYTHNGATAYPLHWYRFGHYYLRGWDVERAMEAAGRYMRQFCAVARLVGMQADAPSEIVADRVEEQAFDPRKL